MTTQVDRGEVAAVLVAVPALIAAVVVVARLGLWALVWPTRSRRPDPGARATAEAALAETEIAVLCDDRSLVLVRTAAIAATAARCALARVLVGADPRLESVGRSLSVQVVPAGRGAAAIVAAVGAARRDFLVITDAGRAVLPGALRPALERFDAETAWVQAGATVPHLRSLHHHVRRRVGWPSLDARDAMPWWGSDSIVRVAAARTGRSVAASRRARWRRSGAARRSMARRRHLRGADRRGSGSARGGVRPSGAVASLARRRLAAVGPRPAAAAATRPCCGPRRRSRGRRRRCRHGTARRGDRHGRHRRRAGRARRLDVGRRCVRGARVVGTMVGHRRVGPTVRLGARRLRGPPALGRGARRAVPARRPIRRTRRWPSARPPHVGSGGDC
ncbi:MAG: hypothetical protein R2713_21420 [Ilumatobacteraceae bacterium]